MKRSTYLFLALPFMAVSMSAAAIEPGTKAPEAAGTVLAIAADSGAPNPSPQAAARVFRSEPTLAGLEQQGLISSDESKELADFLQAHRFQDAISMRKKLADAAKGPVGRILWAAWEKVDRNEARATAIATQVSDPMPLAGFCAALACDPAGDRDEWIRRRLNHAPAQGGCPDLFGSLLEPWILAGNSDLSALIEWPGEQLVAAGRDLSATMAFTGSAHRYLDLYRDKQLSYDELRNCDEGLRTTWQNFRSFRAHDGVSLGYESMSDRETNKALGQIKGTLMGMRSSLADYDLPSDPDAAAGAEGIGEALRDQPVEKLAELVATDGTFGPRLWSGYLGSGQTGNLARIAERLDPCALEASLIDQPVREQLQSLVLSGCTPTDKEGAVFVLESELATMSEGAVRRSLIRQIRAAIDGSGFPSLRNAFQDVLAWEALPAGSPDKIPTLPSTWSHLRK